MLVQQEQSLSPCSLEGEAGFLAPGEGGCGELAGVRPSAAGSRAWRMICGAEMIPFPFPALEVSPCLLYTSDAADEERLV